MSAPAGSGRVHPATSTPLAANEISNMGCSGYVGWGGGLASFLGQLDRLGRLSRLCGVGWLGFLGQLDRLGRLSRLGGVG